MQFCAEIVNVTAAIAQWPSSLEAAVEMKMSDTFRKIKSQYVGQRPKHTTYKCSALTQAYIEELSCHALFTSCCVDQINFVINTYTVDISKGT